MKWLARLVNKDSAPPEPPVKCDSAASCALSTTKVFESAAAAYTRQGNQMLGAGQLDAANEQYRLAICADAQHVDAHINLGFTLIEQGQWQEALQPLRQALALAPASHDTHYLLGMVLLSQRSPTLAIAHLEQAIALSPKLTVAYRDLGKALHDIGRHDRAKAVLQAGLAVEPRFADLHCFLGNVQLHLMELDAALASYKCALAIQPNHPGVHNNLAPTLLNLCDYKGAADAARKALELDPTMHHARSNLLLALSCDVHCSSEEYIAEARLFGDVLMAQVPPRKPVHTAASVAAASKASCPLTIGFVSGDLRNHPVGYFLESVLTHWDSGAMKTIAYSNHPSHDDLTARLKVRFDAWRDVSGTGDDVAAQQIRSDGVDVLIDLSGHTADNRLPLFALRPAPPAGELVGLLGKHRAPKHRLFAGRPDLGAARPTDPIHRVSLVPARYTVVLYAAGGRGSGRGKRSPRAPGWTHHVRLVPAAHKAP